MTINRPLRVFLCHSSQDKPAVRALYEKLCAEPWIDPWLDEEDIFPGDDWNLEIQKAIRETDVIIVCLSRSSVTKEGYVQKEIKTALDYSDEKPDGTVYIIPIRLEECKPPERLSKWQYADYFEGQCAWALQRLLVSLKRRANSLYLNFETFAPKIENSIQEKKPVIEAPVVRQKEKPVEEKKTAIENPKRLPLPQISGNQKYTEDGFLVETIRGIEFVRVPAGKFVMGSNKWGDDEKPQHIVDIPYDYWMTRFPVTNELYNAYAKSKGSKHPVVGWEKKKDHPVESVSWKDAVAYCQWLNSLLKAELPAGLILRLPSEAEWEKAARGTDGREYPWGNEFDQNKCNTNEGGKGSTTSVGSYSSRGNSPYGCADMSGNVWEWCHSLYKSYPYKATDGRENKKAFGARVLRGGSFDLNSRHARCVFRNYLGYLYNYGGFRVVASPVLS